MTDRALEQGIILRARAYQSECTLSPDYARGTIHRTGWVWALLTYRKRPITPRTPPFTRASPTA
jgi:hypothetical protein